MSNKAGKFSYGDKQPKPQPKRNLPPTWKLGRAGQLALASANRDLFAEQEEQATGATIIHGDKELTELMQGLDFVAFCYGARQALSNQSYQSGNEDTFSGNSKKEAKRAKELGGYIGDITITLTDLCRYGYGVEEPSTEQKKNMKKVLETLHAHKATFTGKGFKVEFPICATLAEITREQDGAKVFHLNLNPIFCKNVNENFGELPQTALLSLSKVTRRKAAAHYWLLTTLAIQDKRKTFVRHFVELVKDMKLNDVLKEGRRAWVEKRVLAVIEDVKKTGAIESYSVDYETSGGTKKISRITFRHNPEFYRDSKQ